MKKGMKINVYTDPLTKHDREGQARLVRRASDNKKAQLEYWWVQFPDGEFMRWVDPADVIKE